MGQVLEGPDPRLDVRQRDLLEAPDAELLDTSYMTIDEQVEFVLDKVARKVLTKEFSEQE